TNTGILSIHFDHTHSHTPPTSPETPESLTTPPPTALSRRWIPARARKTAAEELVRVASAAPCPDTSTEELVRVAYPAVCPETAAGGDAPGARARCCQAIVLGAAPAMHREPLECRVTHPLSPGISTN
uniref:Uncharacterized protein n=2 Tax=Aegilops tauschii subsp. strangulata TaxID=200361 RepID=A0A453I449_AEGTS